MQMNIEIKGTDFNLIDKFSFTNIFFHYLSCDAFIFLFKTRFASSQSCILTTDLHD